MQGKVAQTIVMGLALLVLSGELAVGQGQDVDMNCGADDFEAILEGDSFENSKSQFLHGEELNKIRRSVAKFLAEHNCSIGENARSWAACAYNAKYELDEGGRVFKLWCQTGASLITSMFFHQRNSEPPTPIVFLVPDLQFEFSGENATLEYGLPEAVLFRGMSPYSGYYANADFDGDRTFVTHSYCCAGRVSESEEYRREGGLAIPVRVQRRGYNFDSETWRGIEVDFEHGFDITTSVRTRMSNVDGNLFE